MSTKKPRITLTLEPRAYEVISRLSDANGESMSSIVSGFIDIAVPAMERMVVVFEAASFAPQEARDYVSAALSAAEGNLLPDMIGSIAQDDLFLGLALEGANAVHLREKEASAAAAAVSTAQPGRAPTTDRPASKTGGKRLTTPVPVTRGSGMTKAAKVDKSHG